MHTPDESFILRSWNRNAYRWNELVEGEKLESRRLVTNEAIAQVLLTLQIMRILDLGCGEGWLTRRMNAEGIDCRGLDGSTSLIQMAREKGGGSFQCLSYSDIIAGLPIEASPFECIVLNFALFGKNDTAGLLRSLHAHLVPDGKIVIQSLHPEATESKGSSSWKEDVWHGLPGNFTDTYAWYLHSMEDWKILFGDCQFKLESSLDTFHPYSGSPLSVIFTLKSIHPE